MKTTARAQKSPKQPAELSEVRLTPSGHRYRIRYVDCSPEEMREVEKKMAEVLLRPPKASA